MMGAETLLRRLLPCALMEALTVLALLAPAAGAQEGEVVEVVLAAIPAVRETLPSGPAALDPELLCSPRLAGWSCPDRVQEVARSHDLTLHSRYFTRVCPGDERSCRLVGARSLVHFTEPRVGRSTASLLVDVWWQGSDPRRPVSHRRTRLTLRRLQGDWVVEDLRPIVALPR